MSREKESGEFDAFLREEGILDEVEALALKRVREWESSSGLEDYEESFEEFLERYQLHADHIHVVLAALRAKVVLLEFERAYGSYTSEDVLEPTSGDIFQMGSADLETEIQTTRATIKDLERAAVEYIRIMQDEDREGYLE